MHYRVYLRDSQHRIAGAESFYAADDDEAAEMALGIYSLSSDVVAGYELWRGAVRLIHALDRPRPVHPDLKSMSMSRQFRMLDLEERLFSSFVCIREGRQLMAAVTALLKKRD